MEVSVEKARLSGRSVSRLHNRFFLSTFLIAASVAATAWVRPVLAETPENVAGPTQPRGRFEEERLAVGKKNGVTYDLGPIEKIPDTQETAPPEGAPANGGMNPGDPGMGPEDSAGLFATLKAMIFGKERSILSAQASVTSLMEGETDFYWGGFKVWSTKPAWQDGAFVVAAGLPTVSMRAPLVALPVGPVTLRVDAGIAAEATLQAKLMPLVSIPVQFTSVKAELGPEVAAAGFVEGYAKFIAIRAGVGGELELVRANAKIAGQVSFGAFPPIFEYDGFISLLAGKIYGFVDYFNLFRWRWKRALEPTFADWKGKCIDFTKADSAGGDPCASLR